MNVEPSAVAEDGDREVGLVVPRAQVPRGEAVLDAQARLGHAPVEPGQRQLPVDVEAGDHEPVGYHVGRHPSQHVALGVGRHEDQHIAGEHGGVERLGLTERRQVELGEVGDEPAGAEIEAQDRAIAEKSGMPPLSIKTLKRSGGK